MAKILSLRLNYKGKFLDYAKEGKEIKKKFVIGSNKFLQWQILDPAFPDKHTLIKKKGGEYVMELPPDSQVTCERGRDTLDTQYLKQNNLLAGNELVLKEDIQGTLTLAPNWSVDFDFREPWVAVLTPEERAIVAQYARRSKPDSVTRFNRTVIWIVVILTVLFLAIFDQVLRPEYKSILNVGDILQSQQNDAQKVVPDITPGDVATFTEPDKSVEKKPGTTTTKRPGGTTTGRATGSSSLTSALQGFDASAVGTAPAYEIATVAEGFSPGRPGGGRGSGPGIGGSGGPAGGVGAGSSYDPATMPIFGDLGSVVGKAPSSGGYTKAPEGAQGVHVTGDASKLAPSGKAWGDVAKQKKVAASYSSRGISTISEASIGSMDEGSRAKFNPVREQIQARQSQIEQAYRESQITQRVSFTITVYISSNGTVRESVVVPNGSYPGSFVAQIKTIVDNWTFNVREEMAYRFTIRAGK
ncbi:MAG: hypothetical protein PHT37_03160 [Candidatus Cloacimonetes bacterium]|jgi:hypothetical protein|nr:hypothetical protein [Candidatus Cloacimonadota bacterium]MDD2422737.1 hypothetical protein [Candidatus Cloacimonadota bacterium]MDD4276873.1 hypothetical protein [Candidatus Cloacimonadota bacterium]MDY0324559.1 hypothetical protein [Candidatus Cloacimonadaceae bacterium]